MVLVHLSVCAAQRWQVNCGTAVVHAVLMCPTREVQLRCEQQPGRSTFEFVQQRYQSLLLRLLLLEHCPPYYHASPVSTPRCRHVCLSLHYHSAAGLTQRWHSFPTQDTKYACCRRGALHCTRSDDQQHKRAPKAHGVAAGSPLPPTLKV